MDRLPGSAPAPESAEGVSLLASSDDRTAAAVLWNETRTARQVALSMENLPFAGGILGVCRIDAEHASYVDNPASEELSAQETLPLRGDSATWRGAIPGESVVFLRAVRSVRGPLPAPARLGTYVRSHYWFPDRSTDAYADFDPRTWTARLGSGTREGSVAQIGVLIEDPVPRFRVRVRREGPFAWRGANSLFGLRIDFPAAGDVGLHASGRRPGLTGPRSAHAGRGRMRADGRLGRRRALGWPAGVRRLRLPSG